MNEHPPPSDWAICLIRVLCVYLTTEFTRVRELPRGDPLNCGHGPAKRMMVQYTLYKGGSLAFCWRAAGGGGGIFDLVTAPR